MTATTTRPTITTPTDDPVDPFGMVVAADEPEELSLVEQVRRIRLRHQLVPYPVIVALWTGAAAAHAYPSGAAFAVGAALVAAVVWWTAWGRINPVTRREQRRWTTTVTLAGSAWLLWAATAGAGGSRAVVLWLAGYALAWPYWRRHTIPIPPEPGRTPAPVDPLLLVQSPAPVVDGPVIPVLWASEVARDGGPAPRSYLTDHEQVPQGDAYTVVLHRQKSSAVTSALEDIGAALGLAEGEISLDKHPSRRFDRARLLITDTTRSPLYRRHDYPGTAACFEPDTGRAWIGVRIDGAPGYWDLIRPGWGVCGGVVIGATGSGKSRLLDSVITTAAYAGSIVVWIGDPQGGASMPAWIRRADWSGTDEDEVTDILEAGARAVSIRSKVNALYGRSLWTPGTDEPMLLIIVDECHKVLASPHHKERALRAATTIAREGRKAGVGLILATQDPGLPNFGGTQEAQVLRGSLLKGNGACFRVASNSAGHMMPGLDINPAHIPDIPGVLCLAGPSNAPLRGWYLPDAQAEQMAETASLGTLERVTAAYLGETYAGRHDRRLAARGAMAAQLGDLDPELLARVTATDPSIAAALAAHHSGTARSGGTARTTTGAPGGAVVLRLAPPPRLILPVSDPNGAKRTAAEWIYELISAGVTSPAELQAHTGYSETHVRNTLNALDSAGRIRRVRHGEYETAA